MSDKKYDVAITCGVFDMLHQGHVDLFRFMHGFAQRIIVLIHDDVSTYENKKRFPVQEYSLRKKNVLAVITRLDGGYANETMKADEADPSFKMGMAMRRARGSGKIPKSIIYVRGDDWQDFPGRENIEKAGIPITFKTYTEGVSSSKRRAEL